MLPLPLGALLLAVPPKPDVGDPVVTSLLPRGGPVLGSTTVTIRGSNLLGTQACKFGAGEAQPAMVQVEVKPLPSVLCTTPRRNISEVPDAELREGLEQMVSLSTWAGTWNAASLSPDSVRNTFLLGGRLTFRRYHSRTLGVEPTVGSVGTAVRVYATGLADYPFVQVEGRCRFGAVSSPVLSVTSEYVTCKAPAMSVPAPPANAVEVSLALNGQDFIASDNGDARFEYGDGSKARSSPARPLVMLHDVGKTPGSLDRLASTLTELQPDLAVYVPELFGAGTATSRATVLLHLDVQQERLCEYLVQQRRQEWGGLAQGGITLLGVGQGGLLARALVQRGCAGGPEVRALVSVLGPQQGVMRAPADEEEMGRVLDGISMEDPYAAAAQRRVAYAGYWHDPAQPERYRSASTLLADLNAEGGERPEYAARLRGLDALVLVGSSRDEYIVPWQSCFFGFYADGAGAAAAPTPAPTPPWGDVVLLRDSSAYQQDRLGLRTLDEGGRLHVLDAKCLHHDFEAMPDALKLFVRDALLPLLTKL